MLDLNDYKQRLTQRLCEISELVNIGDEAARPVELDQTQVGRLSRMDAMRAQAMSIEAKCRREQELARIKSALQRIDDETFGECLECSEPITQARLDLDPSVFLCIDCASNKS